LVNSDENDLKKEVDEPVQEKFEKYWDFETYLNSNQFMT